MWEGEGGLDRHRQPRCFTPSSLSHSYMHACLDSNKQIARHSVARACCSASRTCRWQKMRPSQMADTPSWDSSPCRRCAQCSGLQAACCTSARAHEGRVDKAIELERAARFMAGASCCRPGQAHGSPSTLRPTAPPSFGPRLHADAQRRQLLVHCFCCSRQACRRRRCLAQAAKQRGMQQVAERPDSRGWQPGVAPCRAARLCQLLLQLGEQRNAVIVCNDGKGRGVRWAQPGSSLGFAGARLVESRRSQAELFRSAAVEPIALPPPLLHPQNPTSCSIKLA